MSRFPGPTESDAPAREPRLLKQHEAVRELMLGHGWWTLEAITAGVLERFGVNCPPASASAQLRHLRKKKFGAYVVEKRHVGNGLYEYQLLPPKPVAPGLLFEVDELNEGVGQ